MVKLLFNYPILYLGIGGVVDGNILAGRRTLSEGRACSIPRATGQTADGAAAAVASTRGGSKEECYRYTQAKASEVKTKGGPFCTCLSS